MRLLLFIAAFTTLCSVSFLAGLLIWFMAFRHSTLAWLRQIWTMLLLLVPVSVAFVFVTLLARFLIAFDQLGQDAEERAWLFCAPAVVAGILLAHLCALHLRIRKLRSRVDSDGFGPITAWEKKDF